MFIGAFAYKRTSGIPILTIVKKTEVGNIAVLKSVLKPNALEFSEVWMYAAKCPAKSESAAQTVAITYGDVISFPNPIVIYLLLYLKSSWIANNNAATDVAADEFSCMVLGRFFYQWLPHRGYNILPFVWVCA